MLLVFQDVTLAQLNASFLYEMSKLMKEEAVERVNFTRVLFTVVHSSARALACNSLLE